MQSNLDDVRARYIGRIFRIMYVYPNTWDYLNIVCVPFHVERWCDASCGRDIDFDPMFYEKDSLFVVHVITFCGEKLRILHDCLEVIE